ncbi:MAG: hypothetical protein RLZ84_1102, partial [Actinomycetota bacterium]
MVRAQHFRAERTQPRREFKMAVTTLPSALPFDNFMTVPTKAPMAFS